MYCLAMHPDILARLREEILSVVGPHRNPTYDDLKALKYLRAVINGTPMFRSLLDEMPGMMRTLVSSETMRLYPPVYAHLLKFHESSA